MLSSNDTTEVLLEIPPYLLAEHSLPDDVAADAAIVKPLGWKRERLIALKVQRRVRAVRKAREAYQKATGIKVIVQPPVVV